MSLQLWQEKLEAYNRVPSISVLMLTFSVVGLGTFILLLLNR